MEEEKELDKGKKCSPPWRDSDEENILIYWEKRTHRGAS
jgi:hypothetical protein